MGAVFLGRCYPTAESAVDAFFGTSLPAISSGANPGASWFEKVGQTWTLKTQPAGGAVVTTVATVPNFPECDPAQSLNDGMTLGWMIAGVMLVAWAFQQLRRVMT